MEKKQRPDTPFTTNFSMNSSEEQELPTQNGGFKKLNILKAQKMLRAKLKSQLKETDLPNNKEGFIKDGLKHVFGKVYKDTKIQITEKEHLCTLMNQFPKPSLLSQVANLCHKIETHIEKRLKSDKSGLTIDHSKAKKYMIDLDKTKEALQMELRESKALKEIQKIRRPFKSDAKNLIPLHHPNLGKNQQLEL